MSNQKHKTLPVATELATGTAPETEISISGAPPVDVAVISATAPSIKELAARNLESRRGVDTFFRVAYREQLDLTALADSKANIMIQVNGLIMSIMLASSGMIITSHAWLLLPCGALTITALISIIFAVMAARPQIIKRDQIDYQKLKDGEANILFWGNFARITEDEFVEGMESMFQKPEHVYLNMTRHIHGLGTILLRKFRMLRVSYTTFLLGFFISVVLFVVTLATAIRDVLPAIGAS